MHNAGSLLLEGVPGAGVGKALMLGDLLHAGRELPDDLLGTRAGEQRVDACMEYVRSASKPSTQLVTNDIDSKLTQLLVGVLQLLRQALRQGLLLQHHHLCAPHRAPVTHNTRQSVKNRHCKLVYRAAMPVKDRSCTGQ